MFKVKEGRGFPYAPAAAPSGPLDIALALKEEKLPPQPFMKEMVFKKNLQF